MILKLLQKDTELMQLSTKELIIGISLLEQVIKEMIKREEEREICTL